MPLHTALLAVAAILCASPDPADELRGGTAPTAPAPRHGVVDEDDASTVEPPNQPIIERVGGDLGSTIERTKDGFRFGVCLITTPLPEGYPDPTPPGAIDLKRYPAVRRAEMSGKGAPERGMNKSFWPLFRHIKSRDIAMTSPVEMEFHADGAAGDKEWTMSFLYRTPAQGDTGTDKRGVVVTDTEPMLVVSLGFQGAYRPERTEERLQPLLDWLAAHPEWAQAGDPRALYYNGPERRESRRWGEVQIPIRARAAPADGPGAAPVSDSSDAN